MFRFFEYVGIVAIAMLLSFMWASFAKDPDYKHINVITKAIASEDAMGIPADGPLAKVHPSDLECMAKNIYFEAGNQSKAGMIAVARVVMNRLQDTRFPNTVCKVIYEGPIRESWKTKQDPSLPDDERIFYPQRDRCQFSWYCDGKPDDIASRENNIAWRLAWDIAYQVLVFNKYNGLLDGATHYHADYVDPSWNKTITLITHIDDHIFYRWD